MVGITDSLRIAVSGLKLAQDQLATTSNNVANAHTEGYTRKRVEQEARVVAGRGGGVREVEISREVDQFLERQLRSQAGELGRSRTIHAYAQDVQGLVFGSPGDDATGLGSVVADLAQKLESAAVKPEDGARRSALVWAAEGVFNELAGAVDQVQTLRRDADQRIAAMVDEVNTALASIDDLNTEIVRSPEDAALLDQRDRLVKDLSTKLDVHTYTHDDNRIAIFTARGQALLEYEPRVLDYAPAATMGRGALLGPIEIFTADQLDPDTGSPLPTATGEALVGGGVRAEAADPADEIRPTVTGGELGGLLEVRDTLLPELDDQLQEFGTILRHQLDAAHNAANPVPPGGVTALESAFTRGELAARTLVSAETGGTAHFLMRDTSNDPHVVSIDLSTVTSFADLETLIDGTANLAANTGGAPTDPAEISATGGWTIVGLAQSTTDGSAPPARLTVDDGTRETTYNLAHFFGFNSFTDPRGTDPTALAVRGDLKADPRAIASAKADVPGSGGEPFALGGVGDGRGLGELAAALDLRMTTLGHGGLPPAEVGVRDYLSDVTSLQAMRAADAERAFDNASVLAEELDFQKAGISGVNLDEEMAYLLELQQAYATSARLLTTADEMLQTLLNAKR